MSKKTETIEVRLSPELKAKLSEACRGRNQSMSRLIRNLVETELSGSAGETTQSGVSILAKSGRQRLREFGIAGVSLLALALTWTFATQTPVAAQAMVRVTFAEMDRDEDGIITRDEYRRFLEADFAFDDDMAEGDFKTPEACEADFAAFEALEEEDVSDLVTQDFAEFDANKDGRLVYDEVRTAMLRELSEEFEELDGNSDGFLTRAEFDSGMVLDLSEEDDGLSAACIQALETQYASDDASDYAIDMRLAFVAMDENRDNRISREEYLNN